MKRTVSLAGISLALLFLLLLPSISGALQDQPSTAPSVSTRPESIRLTIYQDQDLALIEDQRVLELSAGLANYRLEGVSPRLLPDSVQLEALEAKDAVQLVEQRFENKPVSLAQLLDSHQGQKIDVFASGGNGASYQGKLLNTEGSIILQDEDGRILAINDATRFAFPAQTLSQPALLWTLQSEAEGPQAVRLSYLSEGLNWQAHYTAVLSSDRKQLELESWVSITNQTGLTFEQAKLSLVAGRIHRAARAERKDLATAAAAQMAPPAPGFEQQPSFEYHLYTLGRPATLRDGETVRQAFLPPLTLPTEVKYIYEAYAWDGVQVWVEFDNGEKPLPAGLVNLYQRGPQGLQLMGEDRLPHTPMGERVRLFSGLAFDILAKRVQTSRERLGERAWRDSFQITLTNRKSEDVVIQVRERLRGDWKITSSRPQFSRLDAQTVEFRVPVAAGGTATVEYTVEYTTEY